MSLFPTNAFFRRYFDERKHIWIEAQDCLGQSGVKIVQIWINKGENAEDKKQRLAFLVNHIKETSGVFEWYFEESMFSA